MIPMTASGLTQIVLFLLVLLLAVKPLGWIMARVLSDPADGQQPVLSRGESWIYRICGIRPQIEMTWVEYSISVLMFNGVGLLVVWGIQRLQGWLPANPQHFDAVPNDLAWNTAISFATNTNWQAYGGETTMSYFTQMIALTVQNFVSAATGIAVLAALARGFVRNTSQTIGNFWVDMTRSTIYILLPLSAGLALLLVSQGVVQTFEPYRTVTLLEPTVGADGQPVTTQTLALGPAASQVAIKQLGTNGGGFFNVNSAHPFENPTPLTNFLEVISILIISAALCFTFGMLIKDRRQGWALLAAMTIPFAFLLICCYWAEQQPNPQWSSLGIEATANAEHSGGNMEGKEQRFGIANSTIWAVATTAASNGSVNAMHDSFSPLGGLIPMWLMQLGEVLFGGVGSGLYGLVLFALIAVFVSGLMVGRTPEYLGKKIEAFEIKMAMIGILIPCAFVLIGTAVAVSATVGKSSVFNPGPHGFSEILYAFSSASNNNGSAFGGLNANTPFYNYALGLAMLLGRYGVLVPVLAIAGSLASKKITPPSAGTLPTHTPLFVGLLIGTVMIVGALTFVPALALGPVVEHLTLNQVPKAP
ncbi:MAG: potassium-transporting ATPase, subunit [Planctomycetaceae bacterium]|nr:potassium-transporting ATPase, subunit [Planctomycetaceae bacterium]